MKLTKEINREAKAQTSREEKAAALYTVGDLARRYDVDSDTIRRWTRDGQLKAVRVGPMNQRLFEASELERFEAARARQRESRRG